MTQNQKTVLVVEDSPVQAVVLVRFLEQLGLEVLHAPNGRVGVAMAQEHAPDAVVLDIEMPEMNGFEACRQLKSSADTANIPIVMFTVRSEADKLLQGLDLGVVDFIPKDAFSYNVLLETLRQLEIVDGDLAGIAF